MQSPLLEIQKCERLLHKIMSADIEMILVEDELISLFAKELGVEPPKSNDYFTPSAERNKYIETLHCLMLMPLGIENVEDIAEGVKNIKFTVCKLYDTLCLLDALNLHSNDLSKQPFLEFGETFVNNERDLHRLLIEVNEKAFDLNVIQKGMSLDSAIILLSDAQLLDTLEKDHTQFLKAVYENPKYSDHIDKHTEQFMTNADRKSMIECDLKYILDMSEDIIAVTMAQNEDIAKFSYFLGISNPSVKNVIITDTGLPVKELPPRERNNKTSSNRSKQLRAFLSDLKLALDGASNVDSDAYKIIHFSNIGPKVTQVANLGFKTLDYLKGGKKLFADKSMTTVNMSRNMRDFCETLSDYFEKYIQKYATYHPNEKPLSLAETAFKAIQSMMHTDENFDLEFIEEEYKHNQSQKVASTGSQVSTADQSAAKIKELNEEIKRVRDLGERLKKFNNFDVYACGEMIDSGVRELTEASGNGEQRDFENTEKLLGNLQAQILSNFNDRFIPTARDEMYNIMDVLSEEPRVFQEEPPVVNKNSIQSAYSEYIGGLKSVSEDVKKYTERYGELLANILVEFDTEKMIKIAEAYAKQENINGNLSKVLKAKFDPYSYSAPNK